MKFPFPGCNPSGIFRASHTFQLFQLGAYCAAALLLLAAAPSFATTLYGDFVGTSVSFLSVEENTTSAGDPTPLFGAPSVSGDQLTFTPGDAFSAHSEDAGGVDITNGYLQLDIEALDGFLGTIVIEESGTFMLTDDAQPGTDATFAMVDTPIFLVDLDPGDETFGPQAMSFDQSFFKLPGDASGTWTGTYTIDLRDFEITRVRISLDNILVANSEIDTGSWIEKDELRVSTHTPEPGTALLLGVGLCGLALIGRRTQEI